MQLKRILSIAAAAIAAGCAPSATGGSAAVPQPGRATSRWVDSVMATLTLREKAAQMVWPTVLGDYTPGDSP
ncbi:MAG TPA: hypothetical protein VGC52_06930, partial [Gemmatimonadaceae bacterium]